jgi:galactonate dehydratase
MKITRIDPILFDTGMRGEGVWCFVRVDTDEGITGIGECTTTDPFMAAAVLKRLAEIAVGRDAGRIQELWQEIYGRLFNVRGGNLLLAALSGIEQALWDIKGKAAGLPVYELLGGAVRIHVPLYVNHRFFQDLDPAGDPAAYAERALAAVDRGFRAVKIDPYGHLGGHATPGELQRATAVVRAVRDAVGHSVELAVDSHARFAVATAIKAARALEEFELLFFEEPVPPENLAALQKVRQSVAVPLAAGERIYTKWGFRDLLESQAVEIIQPDVAHCGGIFEMRLIAAQAEAHFVQVAAHNFYGPVALVAALHVAASSPNFLIQELPLPLEETVQQRELLTTPLRMNEGAVLVPGGPGLGIALNEEILISHQLL